MSFGLAADCLRAPRESARPYPLQAANKQLCQAGGWSCESGPVLQGNPAQRQQARGLSDRPRGCSCSVPGSSPQALHRAAGLMSAVLGVCLALISPFLPMSPLLSSGIRVHTPFLDARSREISLPFLRGFTAEFASSLGEFGLFSNAGVVRTLLPAGGGLYTFCILNLGGQRWHVTVRVLNVPQRFTS